MGTAAYDKEHTTRVNLKLNNKTDADIIQRLHEVPSIQGYIKTLIRNDMMIKEDDTMMTATHRISIDNGAHYVTPEEAVKGMAWEVIVNYMDDDTREAVAQEGYDDEVSFLARYLELADSDLIIG